METAKLQHGRLVSVARELGECGQLARIIRDSSAFTEPVYSIVGKEF